MGLEASAPRNSACLDEDRGGFWGLWGGVRLPLAVRTSPSLRAATCCGMGDATGEMRGWSCRSKEVVLGRGPAAPGPGFGGCPCGGGPAGAIGPADLRSLEGPLGLPFGGVGSPVGDLKGLAPGTPVCLLASGGPFEPSREGVLRTTTF